MKTRYFAALVFVVLLAPAPAFAYVGLGPGLGMLGSALALIGGIVLAIVMTIAYPIRLLIRRLRTKRQPEKLNKPPQH